jgi:hypothetical protein
VKWIQNTSQQTQARQYQKKKHAKLNASETNRSSRSNEGVEGPSPSAAVSVAATVAAKVAAAVAAAVASAAVVATRRVDIADPACFTLVYLMRQGHTSASGQKHLTYVCLVLRPTKTLLTNTTAFQDVSGMMPSGYEQQVNTDKGKDQAKEMKRRGGKTKPQSSRTRENSRNRGIRTSKPPIRNQSVHVMSKTKTAMPQNRGGGKTRPQKVRNDATKSVQEMLT